jgi:hypothetical protein
MHQVRRHSRENSSLRREEKEVAGGRESKTDHSKLNVAEDFCRSPLSNLIEGASKPSR